MVSNVCSVFALFLLRFGSVFALFLLCFDSTLTPFQYVTSSFVFIYHSQRTTFTARLGEFIERIQTRE